MEIGLLWFDNDTKRSLRIKIERAARRYHEKFGVRPNACLVNPAALGGDQMRADGLRVIGARHILPHHFLVGVMRNRQRKSRSH
jgi:hypothetical protein